MVKSKLDYEKIPVYNLVVRARDRGFYSKSATSGVKIILQDVDDNPPTFDKVLKSYTIDHTWQFCEVLRYSRPKKYLAHVRNCNLNTF